MGVIGLYPKRPFVELGKNSVPSKLIERNVASMTLIAIRILVLGPRMLSEIFFYAVLEERYHRVVFLPEHFFLTGCC